MLVPNVEFELLTWYIGQIGTLRGTVIHYTLKEYLLLLILGLFVTTLGHTIVEKAAPLFTGIEFYK